MSLPEGIGSSGRALDQGQNFARLGVPPEGSLGIDQGPVGGHFERAAGRLHQANVRFRERLLELGRQTGGPWLVVSNDAVLDRDFHVRLDRMG